MTSADEQRSSADEQRSSADQRSADDHRADDDLVHRLAAKMSSADHGTLPVDAAPQDAASTGERSEGGADARVVDLTGDAAGEGELADDVDLGDLVIDLDTYEAAHQLAVDDDRSS